SKRDWSSDVCSSDLTRHERLGQLLFLIYTPLCHQLPERSFFFLGYQVAFCERETAMYTSLFALGLLFGLLRKRIKPWPLWAGGADRKSVVEGEGLGA